MKKTSTPATVVYSCPAGQTLSGTSCLQTTTLTATPNYTCPAGQTLQGSNCIGTNQTSTPATIANYSCPTGYTLSGSTCSQTTTNAASVSYSCPTGYTLNGSTCSKTTVISTATPNYSCPAGQSLSGTQCVAQSTTCTPGTVLGITYYNWCQAQFGNNNCFDPYIVTKTVCAAGGYTIYQFSSDTQSDNEVPHNASLASYYGYSYTVPSWMVQNKFVAATAGASISNLMVQESRFSSGCVMDTYINQTCTTTGCTIQTNTNTNGRPPCGLVSYTNNKFTYNLPVTYTQANISSYSCPSGQSVSGNQCVTISNQSATPTYSCPAGWTLNGSSCTQVVTTSATPNYTCPAGQTLQGSNCIGTNQTSTPATIANYSCPTGYTLSGSTCSKVLTSAATSTLTCPAGQTLSGSSCIQTTTTPATPIYSCPSGATLSGSTCITKSVQSSWVDTCAEYETSSGTQLGIPQ